MQNNSIQTVSDVARQAIRMMTDQVEAWSNAVEVATAQGFATAYVNTLRANLSAAILNLATIRNEDAIARAFDAKTVANRIGRPDLHADAVARFTNLASDGRYEPTERDSFAAHAAEHAAKAGLLRKATA